MKLSCNSSTQEESSHPCRFAPVWQVSFDFFEFCRLIFCCEDGENTLAAADAAGLLMVWSLDKKRLVTQIENAHEGKICSAAFLSAQPILVTSGSDNSIKVLPSSFEVISLIWSFSLLQMWVFDQPDGSARLLKQRSGLDSFGRNNHSMLTLAVRFFLIHRTQSGSSQSSILRWRQVAAFSWPR